jgi:hypothetical protein
MRYFNLSFTFVLWWLLFCLCAVGLEIAYVEGYLKYIFINDVTGLSYLITIILLWQSMMCCIELKNPSHIIGEKNHRIESGWFFSDIVLSLGMVGTVVGFMLMLAGFADLDITSAESAQEMIAQLGIGMTTALTTTLVGLVASIILKLQFFMLEYEVEKEI